jgi:anti-sigma factor RsiW
MRDEHIKDMLDHASLASLSESELARARAHAAACDECSRAYAAARASASMLASRAAESFEPSPFFQTRVLAALRERQRAGAESWSFSRLWKAAGLLVSSMAASVAMLAALTFLVPQQTSSQQVAFADTYTADNLIFSQSDASDRDSYDEVISMLYGADDAAEK